MISSRGLLRIIGQQITTRSSSAIASTSANLNQSKPFTIIRTASTSSAIKPAPLRSKQLADEDIPHKIVCLVDPKTGTLLPAAPLARLLNDLDRTRFTIHLVDPSHEPAICRIIDRKQVYAKQQEKKAAKAEAKSEAAISDAPTVKGPSGPPREVQLSWGVTSHDLGHKLGKAKELLSKGNRVAVIISAKKGADSVNDAGRAAVVADVIETLKEFGKPVKVPSSKGGQVTIEFKRLEK